MCQKETPKSVFKIGRQQKIFTGFTRSVHRVCVSIFSYTLMKNSALNGATTQGLAGWCCREVSDPQTERLFEIEPRNSILDLPSLETLVLKCSFGQITVR